MEYTPTQLISQLNPCDYNHHDLPFMPSKKRNCSLTACRRLAKIKEIRKNLESGMLLGESWRKSGIKSSRTFYSWLEKYHSSRLKNYFIRAQEMGQTNRDDSVEDAFYKKLKDGKASGTEYEFYLTNRIPLRWKKTTEFAPSESGAPILRQRPIINYISVHAENAQVAVHGNGHDGGNGNGKRIEEHA